MKRFFYATTAFVKKEMGEKDTCFHGLIGINRVGVTKKNPQSNALGI